MAKWKINIKDSCYEGWTFYKTYNNYKEAVKSMNKLANKYQVQLIKVLKKDKKE